MQLQATAAKGAPMKADARTRATKRCEQATDFILKGLSYVNVGFILSPCEVRGLLGIKPTHPAWHVHRSVDVLVKMLSRRDLRVEVSPISGLTVTQTKAVRNAYQPISAWVQ